VLGGADVILDDGSLDTSSRVEDAPLVSPLIKGGSKTTVGSFSREEVVAFGGIQDPSVTAPRSSDRVRAQPNADATQLERAVSLANKKSVLISTGTISSSGGRRKKLEGGHTSNFFFAYPKL
jgi:hypothetical protein